MLASCRGGRRPKRRQTQLGRYAGTKGGTTQRWLAVWMMRVAASQPPGAAAGAHLGGKGLHARREEPRHDVAQQPARQPVVGCGATAVHHSRKRGGHCTGRGRGSRAAWEAALLAGLKGTWRGGECTQLGQAAVASRAARRHPSGGLPGSGYMLPASTLMKMEPGIMKACRRGTAGRVGAAAGAPKPAADGLAAGPRRGPAAGSAEPPRRRGPESAGRCRGTWAGMRDCWPAERLGGTRPGAGARLQEDVGGHHERRHVHRVVLSVQLQRAPHPAQLLKAVRHRQVQLLRPAAAARRRRCLLCGPAGRAGGWAAAKAHSTGFPPAPAAPCCRRAACQL